MAKVALITDSHFGLRGDDQIFAEHINQFYKNQFFPYLQKNNINYIIHLGDIMDRRKFVNYLTAKQFRENFLEPIRLRKINTHMIIGNHDTVYKNTNDVNSMNELCQAYERYIRWYPEASEITIDGTKILLVPWINQQNFERTMTLIDKTDAQVCFGHLEIQGFGMYKGVVNHDGISPDIFNKFAIVASGHFHHKSTKRNINYLGAPYQITWSDYDDDRGFHIFDTNTFNLTHITNKEVMFHKIFYDDGTITKKLIDQMDFTSLKNKYVKLIIQEKNDAYLFDYLVEKMEKAGIADLQVVDDHKHLDSVEMNEIVDETSDTMTMIDTFIKNRPDITEVDRVKRIVSELYNEAISK